MVDQRAQRREAARGAVFRTHRRARRSEWVQATGRSMRPTIAPGTWMHVDFGAVPALGDIAVVAADERHVAHRVVALRSAHGVPVLITKGDGEPCCDETVAAEDVVGVVRALAADPPDDASTLGCGGRQAVAIARLSHAIGRSAGRARRASRRLPPPLRAAALRAIAVAAAAASQTSAALLLRAARITTSPGGR